MSGLTDSEIFVNNLCEKSFLSLWTHPNPIGKKNKELCDCLIVCGNYIIIISVKDIKYKDTDDEVGWRRWTKSAIEKSVAQIIGAERWLESVDCFTRDDQRTVTLPDKENRVYYRIAVALGADRQTLTSFSSGENEPWVHITDEYSTGILLTELDTVTDFVSFLAWTEEVIDGCAVVFDGGGLEDLLGLYLSDSQSIETGSLLIVNNDVWEGVSNDSNYIEFKNSIHQYSLHWDNLIEVLSEDCISGGFSDALTGETTSNEQVLITMALEPRAVREELMEAVYSYWTGEFNHVASRVLKGFTNIAYVFTVRSSEDRNYRVSELYGRCLVIRGKVSGIETVVGISNDQPNVKGHSFDLIYLDISNNEWSSEDDEKVAHLQKEFDYFSTL